MSETPTSPAAPPSSSSRLLPSEPHSPRVPAKVSTDGLETTWGERWESEGTYAFDRSAERAEVFSIDTPPPTVSGSLHVGHVFSYARNLSRRLQEASPAFDGQKFSLLLEKDLENLEFSQRQELLAKSIKECLPLSYQDSLKVFEKILGPELEDYEIGRASCRERV